MATGGVGVAGKAVGLSGKTGLAVDIGYEVLNYVGGASITGGWL
ncbi:hypothetical protein GCM10027074_10570 [Streptomyces deserti]